MTTFVHGSKAGIRFGSSGAPTTKVDYSTYFNSISLPQNRDTAETTTFTKGTKTYIPGLRDATLSVEGRWNVTIDGILNGLLTAGEVDFDYAPGGIGTTGTPLYSGKMFLTSYEGSSDIGDVGGVSAEFQISGDVVRTVQ